MGDGSHGVELTNLVISGCGLMFANARDWSMRIPRTYINRCLIYIHCSIVLSSTSIVDVIKLIKYYVHLVVLGLLAHRH